MWFPSWLRNRLRPGPTRRAQRRARDRATFQPRLEALESRWVPSTLTVMNNLDSGPNSLRAEIAAAKKNDTIIFDPSLAGKTITLTSGELDITRSLTIQGLGAGKLSISGGNTSRVFEVDGARTKVTLSGLAITQGNGVAGDDFNPGFGGAIYNNAAILTLRDCTLSGNSGIAGGAIGNLGTLDVSDCTLSDNTADEGGAIYNETFLTADGKQMVSATVSGTSLSGNSAAYGGAIEDRGALTVTHGTLSGNHLLGFVGGSGGAIDLQNALGAVSIDHTTLSGNSAALGFGGAINFDGPGPDGSLFNFGPLTIDQCTLTGNSAAGGAGGAIHIAGGAALVIDQSTLSGNSANTATDPYHGGVLVGRGGAIDNGGGTVTIDQSILCGNSADGGQGGAVCNLDGSVTIHNSLLAGNAAASGGGAYNGTDGFGGTGTLAISRSIVTGNSARTGGGIDNDVGGVLSVVQSAVVGNSAPPGAGEDLENDGSATLIDSLVFIIDGSGSLTVKRH